jgi:hypothetical protein
MHRFYREESHFLLFMPLARRGNISSPGIYDDPTGLLESGTKHHEVASEA